jgi:predicted metal-binding membrane protein
VERSRLTARDIRAEGPPRGANCAPSGGSELAAFASAGAHGTPLAAFRILGWRVNAAVIAVLFVLSLVAWAATIDDAVSMRAMAMGLGQIGARNQGEMGVAVFFAMWITMMVAMMLPTVAPVVLAHLAVMRRQGRGGGATLLFIAGYFVVWSAIGIVPLLAYTAMAALPDEAAQSAWLPRLAGAILVVAGGYQFTGWKQVCFDHCQSPFAFVASHDFGGGALSSLRAGVVHGAYCLGCCWALTTVLLVVGLMNLAWMAAIFALFLVEKSWRHGLAMAKIAGAMLVALGIAVVVDPALLQRIST